MPTDFVTEQTRANSTGQRDSLLIVHHSAKAVDKRTASKSIWKKAFDFSTGPVLSNTLTNVP